jgi:RNA polymerase-binding transcription factor DksA
MMTMRSKKGNPGEGSFATDPITKDAHRTRERLKTMERQNPIRERAHSGDNTPWADGIEELHDDMAKNEYLAAREVLVARLRTLSRAEAKVREGTYGRCDSCGKPIPAGRLKAVPEAVHCVRCAERLEREDAANRQRLWLRKHQLIAV